MASQSCSSNLFNESLALELAHTPLLPLDCKHIHPHGSSPSLSSHQDVCPLLASDCESCIPHEASPPTSQVTKKLHPLKKFNPLERPLQEGASHTTKHGAIIKLFGVDMQEEASMVDLKVSLSFNPSISKEALEDSQAWSLDGQEPPSPHSAIKITTASEVALVGQDGAPMGDCLLRTMYECTFCQRKFASSQAFGGHQNAHKRQRLNEKRIRMQGTMRTSKKLLSYGSCQLYCQPLEDSSEGLKRGGSLKFKGLEREGALLFHENLCHNHDTLQPNNTIGFSAPCRGKSDLSLSSSLQFPTKALSTYMPTPSAAYLSSSPFVQAYLNGRLGTSSYVPKHNSSSLFTPSSTTCYTPPIVTRPPLIHSQNPFLFPTTKDLLIPYHGNRHQHEYSPSLNLHLSL